MAAGHPAETAHLQRQALIGAMMVVAPPCSKVERERIEAQGEGMTQPAKPTDRQLRRDPERGGQARVRCARSRALASSSRATSCRAVDLRTNRR